MRNFGESKETEAALDALEAELALEAKRKEFSEGFSLSDVPELVPEEDDPNVLFRNNWLAYGQSFLVTSSSGVGKSSMVIQMSYNWVMGKDFMACPLRALRICIIQAEDSERDVAEQRHGMRLGLAACGWTEEEINDAERRLVLPGKLFIGLTGDKFAAKLREMQSVMRFDIIIINPAQSFFGGDISAQDETSHFCRELLDPIMKNPEAPCCIGVVTHTPKQKSGTKDGRSNVDDYGEYITAGSHEWTDWARAVMVFMKHGSSDELFDFKGAKRGKRMGWKDKNGNPTTKKTLKHADGYIFWMEATDEDLPAVNITQEERVKIADERKRHDKGSPTLNAHHLDNMCNACHYNGTGHYTNETLRAYARKYWTQKTADAAVKEFEKHMEALGYIKRPVLTDGGRTILEYVKTEWLEEGGDDAESLDF